MPSSGAPDSRATHSLQAPFYFQNLLTLMAPQPLPNGGRGWAVPMDPCATGHPRR
jgi:hypothetical protein